MIGKELDDRREYGIIFDHRACKKKATIFTIATDNVTNPSIYLWHVSSMKQNCKCKTVAVCVSGHTSTYSCRYTSEFHDF